MRDERLKTRVYESAHLPKRESEYLFHKAFLETAGERFHSIKRAKMDAYMLDHYRIEIRDYDLLAGRFTSDFEIDEEKQAVIQQAQTILKATGYMNGGTQAFTAHRVIDYENCCASDPGYGWKSTNAYKPWTMRIRTRRKSKWSTPPWKSP